MLDNEVFYANLLSKGRMKSLLSAIPVYIVMHPQVAFVFFLRSFCTFSIKYALFFIYFSFELFLRLGYRWACWARK